VFLVLADEYVKEGYLFKPSDLLVPLTHESLIAVLAVFFLAITIFRRKQKSKDLKMEKPIRR